MPVTFYMLSKRRFQREPAQFSRWLLPFEFEVTGKAPGLWADKQDMWCTLHDQAGGGDGMDDSFDSRDRACAKLIPFHERRVHPSPAVELQFRSVPGIEEPTALEHADGLLDGKQ
jgi:hypothetical protein